MREMDDVYALPYMRTWHPMYDEAGGIPALGEIRFSLTSNRGCYGDCNFCALTFHEGRIVQVRSHESILQEARQMLEEPDFKGNIYDVGGPTAEFRAPACSKQMTHGACKHRRCLFPQPCPNLEIDHRDYLSLLKKLRTLPGVKKVFIRSGFRFDYLLADRDRTFLRELCQYHISGQLRVAPEHVSDNVLAKMGKPGNDVYREFVRTFEEMNKKTGKEQYIVPYLMSSHPGSTLKDAVALAEYIRELGYMPEQVQDFYPTPGTVSTCMYYTGLDPLTWKEAGKISGKAAAGPVQMDKVYVPRDPHEKAMQRALIQYRDPDNYDLVKEALLRTGRTDLIGFGEKCLIPPRKMKREEQSDRHTDKKAGKEKKNGRDQENGRDQKTGKDQKSGKKDLRRTDQRGGKTERNHTEKISDRPGHGRAAKTSDKLHGKDGGRHTAASGKKRQTKR